MPFLIDGVAAAPAVHAVLADSALTSGMAVFETLRTYDGVPFRLDVHLDRLAASAAWCGFPFERAALLTDLARLPLPVEAKINLYLTGGGRRIVGAEPLDLSRVGAPLRVVTRPGTPPPWLPGRVKHTSRAAWLLAASRAGVDEVVWVDPAGNWTEANRSNLFAVRGGVLWTAPDDGQILQGVTRDVLIEVARAEGFDLREAPVAAGPVDELYLSSTLKELAPVVEVDGVPLPGWGPVGRRLAAAFRRRFAATAPAGA